ncbi:MAG: cation-translocating P-type ATPase [Polyangiales bacterium]
MDLASSSSTAPYLQSSAEVLRALESDPQRGLSEHEAEARLTRYGHNELTAEPGLPAWRRFLAQFQDVLVILLLIATAISTVLWFEERETPLPYEALAILAVVLFNAIMGFLQESRAESAVASLKQLTAAHAQVVRDGERHSIEASRVVPGDILLIEEGDTVAADARVIEATALQTAEAALTGESLPVTKDPQQLPEEAGLGDRHNMLFSSTAVTYGRGRAVVTGTGMQTEMGRIAGMLKAVPDEITPLQKQLDRVGKLLGVCVVVIAVVMIATIVIVEHVRTLAGLLDVLILGVALAVAAVPEGLPAVVTAVLSLGVQRMAKRHAIVRHLRAVETLGSADVIASDKTGTLTKNEMTVRAVVTASGQAAVSGIGYAPEGAITVAEGGELGAEQRAELELTLRAADRANNAALQEQAGRWLVQGDPTEGALIVAARKLGLEPRAESERFVRVAEVPFSSERKLMSTVHTDTADADRLWVFCKGAPDVLLERCTHEIAGSTTRPLSDARRTELQASNEALAKQGQRTLGLALRQLTRSELDPASVNEQVENGLTLAGLVGMIDPPRDEAREAVARAHSAGIRTLMITGDHPITAGVIAVDLGLTDEPRVVTGRELARMTQDELAKTVATVGVYARVDPEHKLRIVQELGRQGAVVAMTGDGVNDAPALKTADIGIAMGITGTDVSKQAANMVLADDNFATIVAAVEEGRAIFTNIRKFLRYLLSSNIGEVMTMFFGVVLAKQLGLTAQDDGLVLPLLATQLLWINLLTDAAPALALGVDPAEPGLMAQPPRSKAEGVITRQMWSGIVFVGAVMAVVTLYTLDLSLPGGMIEGSGELRYGQTRAFTTLMLCQVFNVLNSRSDVQSAFPHMFRNGFLWLALAASVVLQFAVIYLPPLQQAFSTTALSLEDWLVCTALASSVLWLRELSKLVARLSSRRS